MSGVIADTLMALLQRTQELERRTAGQQWRGVVKEVNPQKGTARIVIGKDEDGNDVLSPPLPYAQTAGALKLHSPPSVGQQMEIQTQGGDLEQGTLRPLHWSKNNTAPNDKGDHHVMTFGPFTVTISPTAIIIEGGDMKAQFTPSYIDLKVGGSAVNIRNSMVWATGPSLMHNNKEVGDTHGHISAPPGGPGPPI